MSFKLRQPARLLRYGTTGALNTFVDFSVFALLVSVANVQPYFANLLAFGAAVFCSFVLNKTWTFGDRMSSPHGRGVQLLVFVLCMSATAILCSWLLTLLIDVGLALPFAKISVTLISMLINYVLMSRVIFRSRQPKQALDNAPATRDQ